MTGTKEGFSIMILIKMELKTLDILMQVGVVIMVHLILLQDKVI